RLQDLVFDSVLKKQKAQGLLKIMQTRQLTRVVTNPKNASTNLNRAMGHDTSKSTLAESICSTGNLSSFGEMFMYTKVNPNLRDISEKNSGSGSLGFNVYFVLLRGKVCVSTVKVTAVVTLVTTASANGKGQMINAGFLVVGGVENKSLVGSKFMASGEECLDGWVGAGGGEVKGGGVVFEVSRIFLGEIPRDIMGESDGEAFRVDGGAD
ncbi:hypothetical protein Tco_1474055, partial [Tanacetum coccineum]